LPQVDPALILHADPPDCAILPGLTPTTYGGLASHVDTSFLLSFRTAAPGSSVLSPGESIARMNAANVAELWQPLAYTYGQSGVMDRERLSRIGKALGVRRVIVPMLGYVVTNAEPQVQPFDITIAVTVWVSVYASVQVWDTERGVLEWSSTASCSVAIEVAARNGSVEQACAQLRRRRGAPIRLPEPAEPVACHPAIGTVAEGFRNRAEDERRAPRPRQATRDLDDRVGANPGVEVGGQDDAVGCACRQPDAQARALPAARLALQGREPEPPGGIPRRHESDDAAAQAALAVEEDERVAAHVWRPASRGPGREREEGTLARIGRKYIRRPRFHAPHHPSHHRDVRRRRGAGPAPPRGAEPGGTGHRRLGPR
jgi:hypothetical protein